MSNIININGTSFSIEGPLSIRNGKFYDGSGREIDITHLNGVQESKTINITIEGNVDRLDVDRCNTITVNGDCKKVKTTSGDIKCHNVDGDAESVSGDIACDSILGDARTVSGDIRSNEIKGKGYSTSGKVNGERGNRSPSGTTTGNVFGSLFGTTTTNFTSGDVISGGFTMNIGSDGKKRFTLHKDCTVNGRRIGDMSEYELQTWIKSMEEKGKIVTIL